MHEETGQQRRPCRAHFRADRGKFAADSRALLGNARSGHVVRCIFCIATQWSDTALVSDATGRAPDSEDGVAACRHNC